LVLDAGAVGLDHERAVGDAVADRGEVGAEVPLAAVAAAEGGRPGGGGVVFRGQLEPGQLPGAGEERAVLGAAEEQGPAVLGDHRNSQAAPFNGAAAARRRPALGVAGGAGGAAGGERAARARRAAGGADGGAQLHQRLVAVARALGVEQLERGGGERPAAGGAAGIAGEGEPAGEHPLGVAVERGHPLAEGDARHRGGGVAADPRQLAEAGRSAREAAAGDNPVGGGVELAGTPVVAEPRPEAEHLVDLGGGERLDGREAGEEAAVIGGDHVDPGLLQHDFR